MGRQAEKVHQAESGNLCSKLLRSRDASGLTGWTMDVLALVEAGDPGGLLFTLCVMPSCVKVCFMLSTQPALLTYQSMAWAQLCYSCSKVTLVHLSSILRDMTCNTRHSLTLTFWVILVQRNLTLLTQAHLSLHMQGWQAA